MKLKKDERIDGFVQFIGMWVTDCWLIFYIKERIAWQQERSFGDTLSRGSAHHFVP